MLITTSTCQHRAVAHGCRSSGKLYGPNRQHKHASRPCPRQSVTAVFSVADMQDSAWSSSEELPQPVVKIDNTSDAFATVVQVQFGNRLGELLDTIRALKNLGLNIRRAKVDQSDPLSKNKFYITDQETSDKIVKSARLEEIRLTILQNMLYYHPESAEQLNIRARKPSLRDWTQPLGPGQRAHAVNTTIDIKQGPTESYTVLKLTTKDRPGLLVDIVSVLKDVNVNVISAEVDTVGREARDEFYVTYHGEPLDSSMCTLVVNALQYYLSLAEVAREESY